MAFSDCGGAGYWDNLDTEGTRELPRKRECAGACGRIQISVGSYGRQSRGYCVDSRYSESGKALGDTVLIQCI